MCNETLSSTSLPSEGFLRLYQILGDAERRIAPIIPVGKTTWWAGIASGRYPKPVKIGGRAVAWRVEDIRNLIASM